MTAEKRAEIDELQVLNSELDHLAKFLFNSFMNAGSGKVALPDKWVADTIQSRTLERIAESLPVAEESKESEVSPEELQEDFFRTFEHFVSIQKISVSRVRHYKVIIRSLKRFAHYMATDVNFETLSADMLREYASFLEKEHTFVVTDEGKTWSGETDCTAGMELGYRVVNNARVIRLQSGRVLIPVAWHRSEGFYIDETGEKAGVMVEGCKENQLCRLKAAGALPEGHRRVVTQEPGVIQLADGSVMMYIRADTGYQWYAISHDDGTCWSEVKAAPFEGPLSPATMMRLADGRLLLVWNDHEGRGDLGSARTPLTVAISEDEGASWPARKILEGSYDPEAVRHFHYCYTAALELNDRLLLAYCAEDNLQHLRITSVPLKWLP